MSNVLEEFKNWLDEEIKNGLTVLTLNVTEGANTEQVLRSLLDSEKAIKEGRFRDPPKPKEAI